MSVLQACLMNKKLFSLNTLNFLPLKILIIFALFNFKNYEILMMFLSCTGTYFTIV
jgi:hypothetical protein